MSYALFVMQLTILGYVVFNVAVKESAGMVSLGVMNFLAGILSTAVFYFYGQIKGKPDYFVAVLGAFGILGIAVGLRMAHQTLNDPANVMIVVYDLLVFGSLWVNRWTPFIFRRYQLSSVQVNQQDKRIYLALLVLVAFRLALHWQSDWRFTAFTWAGFAIIGYWLFLASIQLSKSPIVGDRGRVTNIAMNLIAGAALLTLAAWFDKASFESLSLPALVGAFSLVLIVWSLGETFVSWKKMGMDGFVTPGVYEGLMIQAPFAMWLWYGQQFMWLDWPISITMVAIFAYHYHSKVPK